jgi:hypothetical protein
VTSLEIRLVTGSNEAVYCPTRNSSPGCHSACNIDPLSRGIGVQN